MQENIPDEQVGELRFLLQQLWWCKERRDDGIRKMLDESDVTFFVIEQKTGKLVGFARVLTDFVYRALLLDVVVEKGHRGKLLGRLLIDSVMRHPRLEQVEGFILFCLPEMFPFYRRWGFDENLKVSLMVKGKEKDNL